MDKRKKKAISATLAGIMSVGITGSVMTTANAAIVQTETAQQNASPQEVKPDNAVKPADMTAEEAPETVYKVLIDGTRQRMFRQTLTPSRLPTASKKLSVVPSRATDASMSFSA